MRERKRKGGQNNKRAREREGQMFSQPALKCKVKERHKDNSIKLTKFERGK